MFPFALFIGCDGSKHAGYAPVGDSACDTVWFRDADGDGFGAAEGRRGCEARIDEVAEAGDCDDHTASVSPASTEVCNGVDDDCDESVDEGLLSARYADNDEDGYGDPDGGTAACAATPGMVPDSTDCDDADVLTHPGAPEICDGRDNDCDGLVDDDDTEVSGSTYGFEDLDGDGYGGETVGAFVACGVPGYATEGGDCDDSDPAVFPGWGTADMDCDGTPGLSAESAFTVIQGGRPDEYAGAHAWMSDATGDGNDDLYIAGNAGTANFGVVFLISSETLAAGGTHEVTSATVSITGVAVDEGFGAALLGVSDGDGDGLRELVVLTDFAPSGNLAYFLSSQLSGVMRSSDAVAILTGDGSNVPFPLCESGDIDADDQRELVVGLPGSDVGGHDSGGVLLVPLPSLPVGEALDAAPTRIDGETDYMFGLSAVAVDLDGDGLEDLVVGAPNAGGHGTAYVWLDGSLAGGGIFDISTADGSLSSRRSSAETGSMLSTLGDIDGDGILDIAVSGFGAGSGGRYWVVSGADATGPALDVDSQSFLTLAGEGLDIVGGPLVNAGDLDADGLEDLLMSNSGFGYEDPYDAGGRAYVYRGSSVRIGGMFGALTDAAAIFTSSSQYEFLGQAISGAGDVDGDGRDDILMTTPGRATSAYEDAGAAFLFLSTL